MAAYLVEVYVPLLSEDTETDLSEYVEILGKRVFAKYGRVTARTEDMHHGADAVDVCQVIRAFIPNLNQEHIDWWNTEIKDAWDQYVGEHRSFQVLGVECNVL